MGGVIAMDDEQEVKRQLLAKWITQRDNLNRLIEALQVELGEEGQASVVITPQPGSVSFSGLPAHIKIRPDEFFGMSQTEAATAYLKKVGHAVHLDQILDALRAGGLKFSGQDPKTNLYTVLVRATRRFVLISPGTFGLLDFYPDRVKQKDEKKKPLKKKPVSNTGHKAAPKHKLLSAPKKERDRADEQPDPATKD
jgi:hypothetical protein